MAKYGSEKALAAAAKWEKWLQAEPNLVDLFFKRAAELKNKPFLWAIGKDGQYQALSWKEVASKVKAMAYSLKRLGLKRGDRVIILSENRPEWCIADFAVMAAGGISVPVYTTNTPANHQHVFKDCDAHIAIVSTKDFAGKIMKAAVDSFWNMTIICMDPPDVKQSGVVQIESWNDLIEEAKKEGSDKNAVIASVKPDDICCLIYTSGTGGAPKGVMLSHKNIIYNLASASEVLLDLKARQNKERFFSILPLSHAYEHTCGQILSVVLGAEIFYLSGMDKLLPEIKKARPSLVIAVPRLFEVVKMRMYQQMRRKGPMAQKLFNRTVELGVKKVHHEHLSMREKLEDFVLGLLIRKKIAATFGGNIKAFVAGGAPLALDVGDFFTSLGMPILQGYGQTEASPLISCNVPSCCDYATVGRPLRSMEVKFALDGEILLRGEMVMKGYWNNREATDNAIDESGWLHTGDIGEMDAYGRIKITDRKKDIIVNSGGDNISPLRVESILCLEPEISQCIVYGDKQSHLVALIVPSDDFIQHYAKEHGVKPALAELCQNNDFVAALYDVVEKANEHLSVIEKVRKIKVAYEPFSVENNMMTPTLKVRRHEIKKVYEPALLSLYKSK